MSLFFEKKANLPTPTNFQFELRTKGLQITMESGKPSQLLIERETVQRTFFSDGSVQEQVIGYGRSYPLQFEKFSEESGSLQVLQFASDFGDKLDEELALDLIKQLQNDTQ